MKPDLRRFGSLTLADFVEHPVWVSVRSFDRAEPWYDEADEETFRFWDAALPFPGERGIALVASSLKLKDGSVYPGFVSPAREDWDTPSPPRKVGERVVRLPSPLDLHGGSRLAILGIQQPHIFLPAGMFPFWGGRRGVSGDVRSAFYASIGKSPEDIFPIRFYADPNLSGGILSGQIEGFYQSIPRSVPNCSR